MLDICIWDLDSDRIANIEKKLRSSLARLGVRGHLHSNAEPPLVERMNLTKHVPVLEIGGAFWRQSPNKEFSQDACDQLVEQMAQHFARLQQEQKGGESTHENIS